MRSPQGKITALVTCALLLIAVLAESRPEPQRRGLLNLILGRNKDTKSENRYAPSFRYPQKRQQFDDYDDDEDFGSGRRPGNGNGINDVPVDAPDGTQNQAQRGYFYYVPASDWDGELSTFDRIRAYDLPIRNDELRQICENVPAAYCPNSLTWLRSAFIRTVVFSFLSDVLADAS